MNMVKVEISLYYVKTSFVLSAGLMMLILPTQTSRPGNFWYIRKAFILYTTTVVAI